MKKELRSYGLYYLAIVAAFVAGIGFVFGQNWWAMVWALFAGWWVCIALKIRKRLDEAMRSF